MQQYRVFGLLGDEECWAATDAGGNLLAEDISDVVHIDLAVESQVSTTANPLILPRFLHNFAYEAKDPDAIEFLTVGLDS